MEENGSNNAGMVLNTYDSVNGVEYKDRILQRVAHSEGAVVRNDNGFYQHEYVLRDHLGNTRVTFRDGTNQGTYFDWNTWSDQNIDTNYDDGVVTTADIVQENHYYPFGMNLEGNWNGAAGNNQYQYNGKEWNDDFGLGWNDYGARFYDPALGRWNAVDPLAEKAHDWTPYRYGFNNPIKFIDPTGMAEDWIPGVQTSKDEKGNSQAKFVLYAEKGDNYQTLASTLRVTEEKAIEMINNGLFIEEGTNHIGVKLTDDIKGVANIKEAAVYFANRGITDKWWDFRSTYNCHKSSLSIAQNKTPDKGNISNGGLVERVSKDIYEHLKQPREQPQWGDIASFSVNGGTIHSATFLCNSADGTPYFWTKNGSYGTPKVMSQKQIAGEYTFDKVNYFHYVGQ